MPSERNRVAAAPPEEVRVRRLLFPGLELNELRARKASASEPLVAEMNSPPVVSVLITARDNETHIGVALASVLRQTLQAFEVLVVDDGSSDGTSRVAAAFRDSRIHIVRHDESAGISTRRNELVARARAPYVAPLDADDAWLPQRLECHIRLLEAQPEVVAVGSDAVVIDGERGVLRYFRLPRSDAAIRWTCLFASPLIHSASTIRKAVFDEGVRYDPAFPLAQDYDLWTQVLHRGGLRNMGVPLSLYRVHGAQATQRMAATQPAEQQQIARAAIEALAVPEVVGDRAGLAWSLGASAHVPDDQLANAIDAYRRLFAHFESVHREAPGIGEARRIAATTLLRRAGLYPDDRARELWRAGWSLDRREPLAAGAVFVGNLRSKWRWRRTVERLLVELEVESAQAVASGCTTDS
ncbi:MAG: glycosyltransferase family A protein [Thermoleophilia bacterium]